MKLSHGLSSTNLRASKASMPMALSSLPFLTATTMCSLKRDFCSRVAPPDGSRHRHGLAEAAAEKAVASKWTDDPGMHTFRKCFTL